MGLFGFLERGTSLIRTVQKIDASWPIVAAGEDKEGQGRARRMGLDGAREVFDGHIRRWLRKILGDFRG